MDYAYVSLYSLSCVHHGSVITVGGTGGVGGDFSDTQRSVSCPGNRESYRQDRLPAVCCG